MKKTTKNNFLNNNIFFKILLVFIPIGYTVYFIYQMFRFYKYRLKEVITEKEISICFLTFGIPTVIVLSLTEKMGTTLPLTDDTITIIRLIIVQATIFLSSYIPSKKMNKKIKDYIETKKEAENC